MTRDADALMEDLEFLDGTGAAAIDASRRTGFSTPAALEKWLERHGRADLWQRMKARDPEGWHYQARKGAVAMPQPTDSITDLIAEARKSTKARTRRKAEKIMEAVADLRAVIEADRESEKARKEVERLERQLAEAKARLRGERFVTVQDGPSAAELREWATANGVPCPAMGRVPSSVREAYEAAHEVGAA